MNMLTPKCVLFQVPCWHILFGRRLKTILERLVILMLVNLKSKIFLWLPSGAYLFKGKSNARVTSIGRFIVFTKVIV